MKPIQLPTDDSVNTENVFGNTYHLFTGDKYPADAIRHLLPTGPIDWFIVGAVRFGETPVSVSEASQLPAGITVYTVVISENSQDQMTQPTFISGRQPTERERSVIQSSPVPDVNGDLAASIFLACLCPPLLTG